MFSSSTFGHAMRDLSGPCLPSNLFAISAGRFLVSLSIPNGRRKSLLDNYGPSELANKLATNANGSTYTWTKAHTSDVIVEIRSQCHWLTIDLP